MTGGSRRHGLAATELIRRLFALVPEEHTLLFDTGWKASSGRFVPDMLVCRVDAPGSTFLESGPLLAVEVLSASTRRGDLTRKRELYGAEGVAWYWVVDPVAPAVLVLELRDGELIEVQRIGPGETAETVGPYPVLLLPDELVRRAPPD